MRPVRINRWFRKVRGGRMPWNRKRRIHGALLPVFCLSGLILLLLLFRFSGIYELPQPPGLSGLERNTAIFLWTAW